LPNLLILLCVVAAVILAGLSARHYTAVRKKLRPLLPPDIRDASAKRIGLDIVIWSRLVPLQAKRDYLLRLIYGCAGGALLTLAFVLGDRSGFALFTGILTTAGAIQLVISLWKYRQAAGEKATGHADADS
jgi:hypothetical protein